MLDAYFRRSDSMPAMLLSGISPISGPAYTSSRFKRVLDVLIAAPGLLFATVPLLVLLLMNRLLDPTLGALFVQERVGRGGPIRVVKIRSMLPGPGGGHAEGDPESLTRFGYLIRRFYLDELPQLAQVLQGRLSIVGIRVLPVNVYAGLEKSWPGDRFRVWQEAYASSALGLTGIHQIYRRNGKEDDRRFRRDVFYARNARLGFDLYLIWRTFVRTRR